MRNLRIFPERSTAIRLLAALALALLPVTGRAQQTPVAYSGTAPAVPVLEPLAPGLGRLHGQDAASAITYTRLLLTAGSPPASPAAGPGEALAPLDLQQPTLTAQCTQDNTGKSRFEVFFNFGGVADPAFYPPWHPAPGDLLRPRTQRIAVTMNFLGYRKVPAFKRQFEQVLAPAGQLRYVPPGLGSDNLEEFAYFLQYLRALPTLSLTANGKTVDFVTTALQAQLAREPLCRASGL